MLSWNLPFHFWQNDWDLLRDTAVLNTGVERISKQESAQKGDPGEENDSLAAAEDVLPRLSFYRCRQWFACSDSSAVPFPTRLQLLLARAKNVFGSCF